MGTIPAVAPPFKKSPRPTTFEELFEVSRLRKTAAAIRKEARLVRSRDAVDWLDWFVSIEETLANLSQEVIAGKYSPLQPTRFEQAKSHGSFRVMTAFNMRDAIVYRHICDEALERAIPDKVPGAFFSRRHSATPIGKTLALSAEDYHTFFEIWLAFNQYRSHTLLNNPYRVLVVTDITNYFDSIQHDLLIEYLSPLHLPRKAMGLLGRLLEIFKPTAGHSPNPRVGLPVDELDCSRELAHLFLFEHDARVTSEFGDANYVRWMDDQNIGVRSMTEARRLVNLLTKSLSSQRLTLNSGKTKFLTPPEVVEHFQLEANQEIDDWEKKFVSVNPGNITPARSELEDLWTKISRAPYCVKGYWAKVLKRVYAAATRVNSTVFEARALQDLIDNPELDERIFSYYAKRNRGAQLLELFRTYSATGENLFEATEASFFESLLLLDPEPVLALSIRRLASEFAAGRHPTQSGRPLGRASAILCMYWFGEPAPSLRSLFDPDAARALPKEVARAWIATIAALRCRMMRSVQSTLVGHPSDDVARLSAFLTGLLAGTVNRLGNYKSQKARWPLQGKYYDARSWLALDIASCTADDRLKAQLRVDFQRFKRFARTNPEKRVAARIAKRLGP